MCLLALLASGDGTAAINISSTAWPLPIVAVTILIGMYPSKSIQAVRKKNEETPTNT
jgi:hypothetical protein